MGRRLLAEGASLDLSAMLAAGATPAGPAVRRAAVRGVVRSLSGAGIGWLMGRRMLAERASFDLSAMLAAGATPAGPAVRRAAVRGVVRSVSRAGIGGLVCLAALAGCTSKDRPSIGEPAATTSAPAATTTAPPSRTTGPPPGGETEGGRPKACSLVTGADATAALGRKVGPPQNRTLGVFSSCTFVSTGGGLPGTVTVQVLQSAATASMFDQIVTSQSGGKAVQQVPGVGDKAVLATGVLIFHKGDRVVTVFVYTQDKPGGSTDAEIALARKIAARV